MQYSDRVTVNGTLLAKGTATDSIRFVGFANPTYAAASTHGGQIYFYNSSANSQLEYVVIDRWGDKDYYGNALENYNSLVSITHSSIRNSEGAGILTNTSSLSVTNSTLQNNGTGLYISVVSVSPLISSINFVGNTRDIDAPASSVGGLSNLTNTAVYLRSDGTQTSCTIPKPGAGSYYVLNGNGFTISQNTTTTIQPGVEVRSMQYSDRVTVNGTLLAKGTATDSIRFVGFANPTYAAASTHGGQIYFASGSADSKLEYVLIDRWGDKDNLGSALESYNSPVSITHSSIRNSEGAGIVTNTSSLSVTNSTLQNNGTGIYISVVSVSPVVSAVGFVGNTRAIDTPASSVSGISNLINTVIYLRSDATSTSCTIPKPGAGSYYVLNGNGFTISQNTTTTIQPGVEVRSMQYSDRVTVNGTLLAKGTATDSILFVGFANPSYAAASTHGGQIYFYNSSTNSELEYVLIDRWGDKDYFGSAIDIASASVSIRRSSIRNSEALSINISNSISPLISEVSFVGNAKTIEASACSVGGISNLNNTPIYLRSDATNTSCTIPKPGVGSYYVLNGNGFTISQNTTTTIQPGVEVRSLQYSDRITVSGTLIAKGTAADSIRFVGFANPTYAAASTHGGQIFFASGSANSQLEYVVIDRWGDKDNLGSALESYNSPVSITRSSIRNSEGIGIVTNTSSLTVTNSTLQNNGTGLLINVASVSAVVSGVGFVGNTKAIEAPASSVGGLSNLSNADIHLRSDATSTSCTIPKPGAGSYYVLNGNGFTISQNTTTTIQPGVEVRSLQYSDRITVNGTLTAKGTAADSIRFVGFANPSYAAASTHGGQIYFYNSSANSQLEYVVIDRWGDKDNLGSAIDIVSASVSIRRSSIRNSEALSINIESVSISPLISEVSFVGNAKTIEAPASSVGGLSNLTNTAVYLRADGTQTSCTIPKPGAGSYYVLNGNGFTVSQNTTTTLQPGVEMRSLQYSDRITVNGTLIAKGTAIDSIRFVGFANPSYAAASTHGGQIYFADGSANSKLEYVLIDRWGDKDYYGSSVSVTSSSVTITNCVIQNSEAAGIKVERGEVSPSIYANNFSANFPDIQTYPTACGGILNNTNARILINSATVSTNSTWPFPGPNSYYALNERVVVQQDYTLTIEAGTTVDFGLQSGELYINGALRAIGTQSTPIHFTRLQSPSGSTYGGRVYLASSSTNSVLNYVNIDKLGSINNGTPALHIATANFSAANITVSNAQDVGLQCETIGNATIANSQFFNNKTGIYVISGKPIFNGCNIYGNTDFGINNVSTAVADTVDARNSYWGTASGPYHPVLNPSGTGNKVSNKVKFNPWNQRPQNEQIVDLGISQLISPITDCNHTNSDSIRVRVANYGNLSQINIPVSYRVNNGAVTTETISTTLLPGRTIDYTFVKRADLSTVASYTITAYTTFANDTTRRNDTLTAVIQNLPGVLAPANLSPGDNTPDVDVSVAFTWGSVNGATSYDLYVWRASEAIPNQPTVADIFQLAYTLPSNALQYGTPYKWKVVAKRGTCRAASATLSFTTRQLPDLIVESINSPASATSETDIVISWKVKNQGTGATQNQGWTDLVYLCDQPVRGAGTDNFFVNSVPNFSALNAGQSYQSNSVTFRIPQGTQGQYYVIVQTNASQSLQEASLTNNVRSSSSVTIALAPPPDLQVTNVVVSPLNAFSEDSLTVSYTVQNLGTGPTTTSTWTDQILISQTEAVNVTTDRVLFTYSRMQALQTNGSYTVNTKVKLPERLNGTYYIHILTDRSNQVYEYTKEDNNSRNSLPINIIQRPTPNLTVSSIGVSATTAANNQPLTVQWTTDNSGATTAQPTWYETVYLSTDAVFSEAIDKILGSYARGEALPAPGSSNTQQVVNLPATLTEGDYYIFVKTDAKNTIYENPDENDNVSAASPVIKVQNPDLQAISFTAPTTATSEQTITLQWNVKNNSSAGIYNTAWTDKVFLSTNATYEAGSDVLLAGVASNQLVAANSDYTRQTTLTLPTGTSGNYYLILISDADNTIFEKSESNNQQTASIAIILAPWPDLQVTGIVAPAKDTVGTYIQLRYTITNNGAGAITSKNWQDNIYLSPSATIDEASLIPLGILYQNRSLTNGQSFTQAASFALPTSLIPGQYYVIVRTDASNAIFENTAENNNTSVATTMTALVSLPAIDLAVTGGDVLSTTITAGSPISIRWTVKNNSTFTTIIPSWQDAVYLSTNPVLDASDILLTTVVITGPVAAGASYTRTQSVSIPPDAGGTVYILVVADKDNQNNDDKRGNNTLPLTNPNGNGQTVTVTVPPPADLVVQSFSGPATGVTSQPINVTFVVRNNGTGPTPSANWTDQLYLSTDQQVGNDIFMGSFAHTGTLTASSSYTVSGQAFLPNNVSGNYILLLKTDGGETVYERGHEDNNVAFANIFINPQQPSDLQVTQVSVPSGEQFAGSSATISWNLVNTGTNPANGFLREAVYFSKDTVLEATDVLFGTLEGNIFLPSQASANRTLQKSLANLTVGDYYVIVKTDILNNIVEQNESNNQTVAANKLTVTVRELPINVLTSNELAKDVPLYYRLVIPSSIANETLSILLKGDSTKIIGNRLFIRKDSVPTVNQFNYSAAVPFKANQELIVPSLQAGTYYLMALGDNTDVNLQPITLLARVIPFSISAVDANKGGNTGLVTVKITGAKFVSGMTVKLVGATTITATKVYFSDPAKLFATFNLSGATLGRYTVRIDKTDGATTQQANGFEIVTGTPGGADGASQLFTCTISNIGFDENISVDVLHPATVRRNQKVKMTVAYANVGNVDIPVQTRVLLSLEGAPINLTPDFTKQPKELFLEFVETDGPPGILRAGSSGYINFYTYAIAPIALLITQ